MNDEKKQAMLYLWNKIEDLLYGTPRFDVKPQETFDIIEKSLITNELVSIFSGKVEKPPGLRDEAYKDFLLKRLRDTMPFHRPPPEGMPPHGLPGLPGAPPWSPSMPNPVAPGGMPPMPIGTGFGPYHPAEPPGSRMAPGCSGPPTPDQIEKEHDESMEITQMVMIAMMKLGSKYEDEKTYKVIKTILETHKKNLWNR